MADTMQWEYQVVAMGSTFKRPQPEEMEAALNGWGEEGWEVVSVTPTEGSNRLVIVAKRPLTAAIRRDRSRPGGY